MLYSPVLGWLIVAVIILAIDKMQNKCNLVFASYSAFTVSAFTALGVMKVPTPDAPDYPYYSYYLLSIYKKYYIMTQCVTMRKKPFYRYAC